MIQIDFHDKVNINLALSAAKAKGKDLLSIEQSLKFCENELISINNEFKEDLLEIGKEEIIRGFYNELLSLESFEIDNIKSCMNAFLDKRNLKMKELALPLRIILTGSKASPGIFEVISILGKELSIKRISSYLEL